MSLNLDKLMNDNDSTSKIAIFASGSGSNAQAIIEYLDENNSKAKVSLILSNNPEAYVLQRAFNFEIPSLVFDKKEFYETDEVLSILKKQDIDLIVLAGFLWLIPEYLIKAFPNKIINIHPSLLPKFGGKNMYGDRVHKAVLEAKEKESGITIHYVNEHYDEGKVIYQAKYKIDENDTLETIKLKGQKLEHQHFPRVVEKILLGKPSDKSV